jgi:hypothetical protein
MSMVWTILQPLQQKKSFDGSTKVLTGRPQSLHGTNDFIVCPFYKGQDIPG